MGGSTHPSDVPFALRSSNPFTNPAYPTTRSSKTRTTKRALVLLPSSIMTISAKSSFDFLCDVGLILYLEPVAGNGGSRTLLSIQAARFASSLLSSSDQTTRIRQRRVEARAPEGVGGVRWGQIVRKLGETKRKEWRQMLNSAQVHRCVAFELPCRSVFQPCTETDASNRSSCCTCASCLCSPLCSREKVAASSYLSANRSDSDTNLTRG